MTPYKPDDQTQDRKVNRGAAADREHGSEKHGPQTPHKPDDWGGPFRLERVLRAASDARPEECPEVIADQAAPYELDASDETLDFTDEQLVIRFGGNGF